MSHSFLSISTDLIPQETKDNIPTFHMGLFSNDKSRMLIDGYNAKGEIVHPKSVMLSWLQWDIDPESVLEDILSDAVEYTKEQIKAEQRDTKSIWYVEQEELI